MDHSLPSAVSPLSAHFYLLWAVLLILLGQLLRREVSLASVATWLAWFQVGGGVLHVLVGTRRVAIPTK